MGARRAIRLIATLLFAVTGVVGLSAGPANAQEVLWLRQYGTPQIDLGLGAATDAEGNVIVVGVTTGALARPNDNGQVDAFVRKISRSGGESWTVQFGSGGDIAYYVAVDPTTGNVHVSGRTVGSTQRERDLGLGDAFVQTYDQSGAFLRRDQFGSAGDDEAVGLATDGAGNLFVGGRIGVRHDPINNPDSYDNYAFVRKYNSQGVQQWHKQWGTDQPYGNLQNPQTIAYGVATSPDGSVYVTGLTDWDSETPTSGDPSEIQTVFLRKLDGATGDRLNGVQFGSGMDAEGNEGTDRALAVATDSSGNVFMGGGLSPPNPGNEQPVSDDGFLRKYNSNLQLVWERTVTGSGFVEVVGVATDPTGNAYVVGCFGGTARCIANGAESGFVRQFLPGGQLGWTHTFDTPGSDEVFGVAIGAGNMYVSGLTTGTLGQSSAGSFDAFVGRFGVSVDLAVTQQAPASAAVGPQTFNYEISVTHQSGSVAATGVTVTDTLPPSVAFETASAGCTYNQGAHLVTCNIASISPGAQPVALVITVRPVLGGTATNNVSVTADQFDPDPADNQSVATTNINGPSTSPSGCANIPPNHKPPICP